MPVLPWILPLGLLLLEVAALAVGFWPAAAMLLPLILVYGMVPVPHIKIPDVVTVILCIYVFVRRGSDIRAMIALHRRQLTSLLVLAVVILMSAIFGYFYNHNFHGYVYSETVGFVYWLLFPASALLCMREKTASSIFWGIITMGVLLAVVAVVQSLTGWHLSFSANARLEVMDDASGGMGGIKRSIVPGVQLTVFAFFNAIGALVRKEGRTWAWALVALVCMTGIFVNFGRALWAITFVCLCVQTMLMGRRCFVRFLIGGSIFFVLVLTVAFAVKPELITATVDRMASVGAEGASNSSLGWRIIESEYAIPKIYGHPIFGIGMGGEYKPRLIAWGEFAEQTHYIHNAYLYILLKTGIVGLILILTNHFLLLLSVGKLKVLREVGTTPQAALTSILISIPLLSMTQPELFSPGTVACLAILTPVVLRVRFKSQLAPNDVAAARRKVHMPLLQVQPVDR